MSGTPRLARMIRGPACDRPVRGISAEVHREVMSVFPTGVAVVTSVDSVGRPWGLTCSSLVSVTLRPPTLLVCVRAGSPTLRAIRERGAYGVNILHSRARRTARLFSSPVADRFDRVPWRIPVDAATPWLYDDALAFAECVVAQDILIGDHAMLLGTVQTASRGAGAPLLYGLRRFAAWSDDAEEGGAGG